MLFGSLAIATGLSLGMIAAEVALRAYGWPAPGLYIDGQGPVQPRDPGRHGSAYPRAASGRMRHYDYDVSWTTNEHGFRERSPRPKAPSEWRIGLFGDSFTSGMGVEPHQTYVAQWFSAVRSQLGRSGRRPETWNLASPMAATAHEADILEGVGSQYALDEIIVGFYSGNDLQENVAWDVRRRGQRIEGSRLSRARVWLREHSRLASFVWVNGLRTFATFTPPGMFDPSMLPAAWSITETALNRLADRAAGRPMTIWYLPSGPEWDEDSWKEAIATYSLPAEMRGEVRERVQRWAARRQIHFVDFTPFLRACRSLPECTLKVDGHWNATGHRKAAEGLIAAYRRTAASTRGARSWPQPAGLPGLRPSGPVSAAARRSAVESAGGRR